MFVNTTKVITFTITFLIQLKRQQYITQSKIQLMTLIMQHLVHSIFKAVLRDNTTDVRFYYDVICKLMKDNPELQIIQELNDVVRLGATYLIEAYS